VTFGDTTSSVMHGAAAGALEPAARRNIDAAPHIQNQSQGSGDA